jgi:hypothetical protein
MGDLIDQIDNECQYSKQHEVRLTIYQDFGRDKCLPESQPPKALHPPLSCCVLYAFFEANRKHDPMPKSLERLTTPFLGSRTS